MKENLKIWDLLKSVPAAAKKKIFAGRLKGMTDIKPQWRLQMMTEQFGAIGVGWYYDIINRWTEEYANEVSCYVSVKLFIKDEGEWSKPICGIGGSMLIAQENVKDYEKSVSKEKYGSEYFKPHHSDECYKMALTDALSVAMKQLGVAADVYMGLSDSKYDKPAEDQPVSNNGAPFNEYKEESVKQMTHFQKSTLKDLLVKLEKNGSASCQKAITGIDELLGHDNVTSEFAESMIHKVNLTLGKESSDE
jgi:hypothetical protein